MSGSLITILGMSLAVSAFVPAALAQSSCDEAGNKALVEKAFAAWASGTGTPYDLLADDAVWTITGNSAAAKIYPGREAFLGEVIRPFVARMSVGLKPVIREIHADGDTVIVYFDAAGTARDGQPYENTYVWLLGIEAGKIVKATAFFDSIAFNALWDRVKP